MKTPLLAPSSTAAQPTGSLPWVSSGAVRGERRWFSFSASLVSTPSTETVSFLRPSSLSAGGAVGSKVLRSVAQVQKASGTSTASGSRWPASSNMSVKRDCGIGGVSPIHSPRAAAPYLQR